MVSLDEWRLNLAEKAKKKKCGETERANSQGKNKMKRTQKGREMTGERKADKKILDSLVCIFFRFFYFLGHEICQISIILLDA